MSTDPPHPASDLPLDKIDMLAQPLTTEEGYLNEACIRELECFVRRMPRAHERLAGNPEWSTPWVTTDAEILGSLAGCAVDAWNRSPPNLAEILGYVKACLRRGPFKDEEDFDACGKIVRLTQLSLCQINKFLWDVLGGLPQFMAWGDDEIHKDWVDLDALLRNVCVEIRNRRRHNLAFDSKFEREHPGLGGE